MNKNQKGRVLACSDLHGSYDLYWQIKQFLKPEDKVIFLGDATDRGPHSWKLMKAILDDEQWEYLCGNHEDMLAKAINEYYEGSENEAYIDLLMNGGNETFMSWLDNGAYQEWAGVFTHLPYYTSYINQDGLWIMLSHAGFTPIKGEDGETYIPGRRECLWSRSHFEDQWDEENFADVIVVHGHTPIPTQLYTNQEKIDKWNDPGAYYYCGGHKINIDCGACWIKATILLDLDTFDEYIFKV